MAYIQSEFLPVDRLDMAPVSGRSDRVPVWGRQDMGDMAPVPGRSDRAPVSDRVGILQSAALKEVVPGSGPVPVLKVREPE